MEDKSEEVGQFTIAAKSLCDAVRKVVSAKKRRSKRNARYPINLSYDSKRMLMQIADSQYGLVSFELPLKAKWPDCVQVDGLQFTHVLETYNENELLKLTVYHSIVKITRGNSVFSMARLDAPGCSPVERKPLPPNRRHKGPVRIKDEAHIGRVELDTTWDFSARMPVPQHLHPNSQIPAAPANVPPDLLGQQKAESDNFSRRQSEHERVQVALAKKDGGSSP